MGKRGYFWLGAFGSFSAYFLLVFTLYLAFFASEGVKKIALKSEQSAIEVSMVEAESESVPTQPLETRAPIQSTKVEKKTEKEPQKTPEKLKEEGKSVRELISGILPKKTVERDNNQSASIQTKNFSSARDLLANLSIKKNSDVSFSSNSGGEVNEYLSNIAKLIKQGWSPTKSDVGFWAVIFVKIEPDGSFTYRVKRGSDREFVYKLENYFEFLKKRGFPPPTDGKSVEVEFNFKVKE